ncbi:ELAV-like protein 2 [Paramacrobiotus metropolitanus]|uniref:ELAV-like protein 2 n=1 Tax=Paramacrobiotus metropolitanus TaxID=2943436 RepID=UPI002445A5E4|nr:ELAV-like protein 2 [Paramacrobiotus metropolitanus]
MLGSMADTRAGVADLPAETESVDQQVDRRKLIVTHLPMAVRATFLRNIFGTQRILGEHGTLVECRVAMRTDATGREFSRGFGFLTYSHEEAAARAIELLNGFCLIETAAPWEVDDHGNPKRKAKNLKVAYCRPPGEAHPHSNLFVTGIPCAWQLADLQRHFSQWGGTITTAKIAPRTCPCNGGARPCEQTNWGFVRFARREEAMMARDECFKLSEGPSNPSLLLQVTLLNDADPRFPHAETATAAGSGHQ